MNLYSLCQLYKEVIVDEHKKNQENAMNSEQIASIIDGSLSVLDILDQLIDVASLFPQHLSQSTLDSFNPLFSKWGDDIGNELKKIERGFDRLELTKDNWVLTNAHLWHALQECFVIFKDVHEKDKLLEPLQSFMFKLPFEDETRLVGLLTDLFSLFQKYKKRHSVIFI